MKVLYQVDLVGANIDDALSDLISRRRENKTAAREDFARKLIDLVKSRCTELDDELRGYVTTDWNYDRLGLLERCILRIAAAEILFIDAIPLRVSIDEAVEMSKCYIGADAGKLVNGILHRLAVEKDPEGLERS